MDASDADAGLVLMQAHDFGIECVFCQRSSLLVRETTLSLLSLKHFDVYVGGGCIPLVVYTDHNPLTFLNSLQCPNQHLVRWSLFLQSYSLDIRYNKRADNVVADALFRAPVESRCTFPPGSPLLSSVS